MHSYIKVFLILFAIVFIIGCVLVFTNDHGFMVLLLNENHNPLLDFFFKYWTYLGDGIAVVFVIIVLLFFRRRHAYVLAILGIVLAIVSGVLKKVVFGKVPRPAKFFEGEELLNFVEGVKMHHWHSFPSGHTMTAFVLAGYLMLMIRNTSWSVALFTAAVLVGVSRVYLGQHFLVDTLAGSFVGLILAGTMYYLFRRYLEKDISNFNQNG